MIIVKSARLVGFLFSVLIVASCGGGGGGDSSGQGNIQVNSPPVANAGADFSVDERLTATLDGSASRDANGNIASYNWRQVSGQSVSIGNSNQAKATFTAPEVPVDGDELVFELTVRDTDGASNTDSVSVTINNVNLLPVSDAGIDRAYYEGKEIVLDGSNSSDEDGSISSYLWELVSGVEIDIPDPEQVQVSFVAPATSTAFDNVYRLTVTDDLGDSDSDEVVITIKPIVPPDSNAGPDQLVESESTVELQGSNSTDSDGEIIAYQWIQLTGPQVTLNDPGLSDPSFTAPLVTELTLLQFELTVTDDADATATDVVDITVTPPQHEVSGTISIPNGTLVDSDVNDESAPYKSNSNPDEAQFLPKPVTVGGYSNRAGQGESGRSYLQGDVSDYYRIQLAAGEAAAMKLVAESGDLDLYLWDQSGTVIYDISLSVSSMESVSAPADGEYLVEVYAYSGASNYVLTIDGSANASPRNSTMDFVPYQAIVKPHSDPAPNTSENVKESVIGKLGLKRSTGSDLAAGLFFLDPTTAAIEELAGYEPGELTQRSKAFADPDLRAKWETLLTIKILASDEKIQYAEPNFIRKINFIPDDEFYDRQWHYPFINVPQAWDMTLGSPSVIVAVIDTGVLLNHPDLQGVMSNGYDFISSTSISNDGDGIDPDPDDPGDGCGTDTASFHGTHVAGTIGANTNNQIGVAGIAPASTLMPLRVLGCGGGTTYDVGQAMLYAAGLPNDSGVIVDEIADVINLSLGGGGYSQYQQDNVDAVRNAGVIIVAAAGNDNSTAAHYPSSYAGVISVSAVDADGEKTWYSNYGPGVDVAAPGGGYSAIYSTDGEEAADSSIEFTYEYKIGTSMAAPHVAGVLALMKSVNASLTPADIDAMLVRGEIVTDIGAVSWDDFYGWGLIDAQMAVNEAIASIGNPPADRPAMIVSPNNLHFGAFTSSASIDISNAAGGELIIESLTPTPDASWLSISPEVVDANGVGKYLLTVTRAELAEGPYAAEIAIQSNSNSRQIGTKMIVPPELVFSANAGRLYVVMVDSDSGESRFVSNALEESGAFVFSLPGVYEGTYRVVAGSDSNYDFFICDSGESCGAYGDISNPTSVFINEDRVDIDFTVSYDWFLPSTAGSSYGSVPAIDVAGKK